MTNLVRLSSGLALLCALLLVSTAAAQSEELRSAMELFDRQEYVAAQNLALSIDREKLSDAEKAELDRLLKVLPEAIQGGKKAEQDRVDADQAYGQGRWDEADRLYRAVLANKYASTTLRNEAREQCKRIAEKKQLSEAAKPKGPVSEQPAGPPAKPPAKPEEPAAEPGAPEAVAAKPQEGPQRLTVVDEMRLHDQLRWERAVAKMEELRRKAQQAITAEQFDEASQFAAQALNRIEAARIYAEPVSLYETAKAQALALKQEVEDKHEEYLVKLAAEEREEIMKRQTERTRLLEQRREEKVEQLFNTAHQLRKEQRFKEAAEAIRQILYLEPANVKAVHQLEVYEDFASLSQQKATHRDQVRQMQLALTDAHETLTPWSYEVLYPRNWEEITRKRAGMERGYGHISEDDGLNRKLEELLPEVLFEEQPVEQVVEWLADLHQVNLAVDWEDLEANGINRDKTVSLKLRDVTLHTVLDELLSQLGGSDVMLGFSVGSNLLRIASKEKLDRDKFTVVYDIRDLLVNVPRFTNAQRLDATQALRQVGQNMGGGMGGGSGSLFSEVADGAMNKPDQGLDATLIIDDLLDVIRQNVEPDSWRETGGGDANLRELNGELIVYNTTEAHEQVTDLLSQLRETRALQIAIEARFLTVTDNFLEEMGVDLDFVFNAGTADFDQAFNATGAPVIDPFSGSAVLIPREYSRIGSYAATPGFGLPLTASAVPVQPFGQAAFVPADSGLLPSISNMTPIGMQQGSLALVNPGNINTGVPGTLGNDPALQPALNIAGSFLDNLQVDFLIRATQANRRSSIVQAPRLVLFNGQRANIFVGTVRTYVASLQPQLAEGAAAFAPQISTASSGTTLDVDATISADRRYVTVTVTATQANPPRLERVEIQRASGNSPGAFVTTLEQQSATVNTTVSIPDGGTVLLGGVKLAGEAEIEAGVPILSKIPILKRAFTNATTVKDVMTLLILMKAKIIIQKEAEEEAFPTLSRIGPG
jgi:general secretion pathway protein D